MKVSTAVFFSLIVLILFIIFTLFMNAEHLYEEELQKVKLMKIQKVCKKSYRRQRKLYIPQRSIFLAQDTISTILKENPITFNKNGFSLELKSQSKHEINQVKHTLSKLVGILNHLKEDTVLSITAHTDINGSAQHNLLLSQKRADALKSYFFKRTNLALIVAIGYGESLPLTSRRVEINLKRIY